LFGCSGQIISSGGLEIVHWKIAVGKFILTSAGRNESGTVGIGIPRCVFSVDSSQEINRHKFTF